MRLASRDGKRPVVDADQTCYFEDNTSDLLYMTRIFYCYGTVHEELIGMSNSDINTVECRVESYNPLSIDLLVKLVS